MKKLVSLAIFLLPWIFATPQNTDTVNVIFLKPSEFAEEMKTVSNAKLVDVREFFEFKRSRIRGAFNVPSSGNTDIAADTIDKTAHLFLYCTSGFRSRRVAQHFAGKGFIHVYSLEGGITAWKKEGFPVEKKKIRKK